MRTIEPIRIQKDPIVVIDEVDPELLQFKKEMDDAAISIQKELRRNNALL